MTELKTLKDFDFKEQDFIGENAQMSNFHGLASIKDLKQEAIKWVKQHRNIKPNWAKETNEEFFMAFFNLTEEDLK